MKKNILWEKYVFNEGYITQKIGNKTTLFSAEQGILITLNDTANLIFQGLKLGWSEEEIIQRLNDTYNINQDQAKEDLNAFIKLLLKNKIISK